MARAAVLTFAASAIGCGSTPTAPADVESGYTLTGTVTEMAAGARVAVEGAVVRHEATGRSAATDGGGRYTLADLPGRMATITVMKDGYENATGSVDLFTSTSLDVLMIRRRAPLPNPALSGIVYESSGSGQVPLAGVVVENGYTHGSSITDANGRYRLEISSGELGMTDGFAQIMASKEGYAPFLREVVVEGETRLDIELVRR
jgi:hypothetical protein